jgi:hypothetical protein
MGVREAATKQEKIHTRGSLLIPSRHPNNRISCSGGNNVLAKSCNGLSG